MAFPTTSVLDNFNRADEAPLANSTWTTPLDGSNSLALISNKVGYGGGAGALAEAYWSASTFGPDAEAYVDLVTRGTEGQYSSLWLRVVSPNTGSLSGYRARFNFFGAGDVVELHSFTADAGTSLTNLNITPNLAAGDAYGFEVISNHLTVYKRVSGIWSSVGTFDDSTNAGAGYIGLTAGTNTWVGDNFGGGTVVTGATTAQISPAIDMQMKHSAMIGLRYV